MKIFITGATGFIGNHVTELLSQTEHEMCCLVRKTSDTGKLKKYNAQIVVGDVADKASILRGMQDCDWVVNLANHYSFWEPDNKIYEEVNVKGTQNVLEACLETGIAKVIHVSSIAIYGNSKDMPVTENSEVGSVRFSEYGESKYKGDIIAWELFEKKGLPLVMIYPAAVYGPNDPNITGYFVKGLINRIYPATMFPSSPYTIVHVKDVAKAIVRALEKEDNIGEKYLIGKSTLKFKDVYRLVGETSGVPIPKLALPNFMSYSNAAVLTLIANITKRPPMWGLSLDLARVMREGFSLDGSKAERELGITYTPARETIADAVASFKN